MHPSPWFFLSHAINSKMPIYGDGAKPEITKKSSIAGGDPSNSLFLKFSNHSGTHMDFPFHFLAEGKSCEAFGPEWFAHNKIFSSWIDAQDAELISVERFQKGGVSFKNNCALPEASIILLRSGAALFRNETRFWERGPGISVELAEFLKTLTPNLKMLVVDAISVTSYQHRPLGREVHKILLGGTYPILLVEDCSLELLQKKTLQEIIVAPLRIDGADGVPVTVMARF